MVNKSRNEILKMRKFEFFPSTYPSKYHGDVIAGRQIGHRKIEIVIILNFMTEILNPPCNSLIATFFELCRKLSEERAILLEDISSSQVDTKSILRAAVPLPPVDVPEEKVAGGRGEESPVGGPEGPTEVGGVCETEAGTEADVEDKHDDVDVVGDVNEVGVSGYEPQGFTLSENLRRKRLAKRMCQRVSLTAFTFPQCEFSKLQHLPLAFLLEFSLLASH